MAEYIESAGYRSNAARKRTTYKNGAVTVYAERTNNQASLGEYGGDAYPAVFEQKDGKYTYGMIIAADGIGQASFLHPSLENYLSEKVGFCADTDGEEAKLSLFLRTLYGAELFAEENADALEYALKSFAPVPTEGFYLSDKAKWGFADNVQSIMPLYKRESQWLGSRIVCVGLYLKFRNYFVKNKPACINITERVATQLKKEIENYLYGELAHNIADMFSHDDAPSLDKKARYFLSSTVAMWFYVYDEAIGRICALSLNMGDTRCYASDVEDGVRQISVDDALADGCMTAFVHFGTMPKKDGGYTDGTFRARLVECNTPCALFACTDGIYDTCPELKNKNANEQVLGSKNGDAVDFLFEKNLLDAMRRCYSLDDFIREIVFNFYAHANTSKGISERRDGQYYPQIKRDDGGTLGARFFGKTPLELFTELRKTQNTSLDALYKKVIELKSKGVDIPISKLHESSAEQVIEEKLMELADKLFGADFANLVKNDLYPDAFEDMKKAGSNILWGITVEGEKPLMGYMLVKFFRTVPNKIAILKTAIADWKEVAANPAILLEWRKESKHKHIIVSKQAMQVLNEIKFADIIAEAEKVCAEPEGDNKLEMYQSFYKCFMGEVGERAGIDKVGFRANASDLDKYLSAEPTEKETPVPAPPEKAPAPKPAGFTSTVPAKKDLNEADAPTERDIKLEELAEKLFAAEFLNILKNDLYIPAFEDMQNAGSNTLWGITVTDEKPAAGYMLSKFFKIMRNKVAILKTAVADWKALSESYTDYYNATVGHKHEHVIVDDDVLVYFKNSGFSDIAEAVEKLEREGE